MTRHITALAIVLVLAIAPLAAQQIQYYSGEKPLYGKIDVYDTRTDMEKLEDRVEDLEFENSQQQHQIDLLIALAQGLDEDLAAAEAELATLAALAAFFDFDGADLTIRADNITLDADDVEVTGDLQCDTLTADSVDADAYTPGAGNIW